MRLLMSLLPKAFRGVDAFTYTSMQTLFANAVLFASIAHPLEANPMLNYDECKLWSDAELVSLDSVGFSVHMALLSVRWPLLYQDLLESTEQPKVEHHYQRKDAPLSSSDSLLFETASDDVSETGSEPASEVPKRPKKTLTLPCKADALEFLITYLYTERMEASGDQVEKEKLGVDLADLLPIAVKYNMQRMHAALLKLLADLWNMKTIFRLARRLGNPDYTYLQKPAFEYMARHYKSIVSNREELDKLEKTTLIDLMQVFYDPKRLESFPLLIPPTRTLLSDMKDLYLACSSAREARDARQADFILRFDMTRPSAASTSSEDSSNSSPITLLSPAHSPRSISPSPRGMSKSPSMPAVSSASLASELKVKAESVVSGLQRASSFANLATLEYVEIYAHKFVLSSRSRFFDTYLRSRGPSENSMTMTPEIGNATQPNPTAMRSFLQYLYTNEVAISPQDAIYFLDATEYYGLQDDSFERQCRQVFSHGLTAENVLQTFSRAHSVHNEYVKETALDFITRNFPTVSAQPFLQQLDRTLLLEIIQAVAAHAKAIASQSQATGGAGGDDPTAPPVSASEPL